MTFPVDASRFFRTDRPRRRRDPFIVPYTFASQSSSSLRVSAAANCYLSQDLPDLSKGNRSKRHSRQKKKKAKIESLSLCATGPSFFPGRFSSSRAVLFRYVPSFSDAIFEKSFKPCPLLSFGPDNCVVVDTKKGARCHDPSTGQFAFLLVPR